MNIYKSKEEEKEICCGTHHVSEFVGDTFKSLSQEIAKVWTKRKLQSAAEIELPDVLLYLYSSSLKAFRQLLCCTSDYANNQAQNYLSL